MVSIYDFKVLALFLNASNDVYVFFLRIYLVLDLIEKCNNYFFKFQFTATLQVLLWIQLIFLIISSDNTYI